MTQETLPHASTDRQILPGRQEKLLADILRSTTASEHLLAKLNSHKLVTVYDSTARLLWLHFLKGCAFGLGSVVGAGIVVSIIAYLLSKIEFLPIIGEWVKLILLEINR